MMRTEALRLRGGVAWLERDTHAERIRAPR
jgi:hypothetical protein